MTIWSNRFHCLSMYSWSIKKEITIQDVRKGGRNVTQFHDFVCRLKKEEERKQQSNWQQGWDETAVATCKERASYHPAQWNISASVLDTALNIHAADGLMDWKKDERISLAASSTVYRRESRCTRVVEEAATIMVDNDDYVDFDDEST